MKRKAVLAALAVLAGCGAQRMNTMIGAPVRLPALRPPHEAIYVRTSRGVERVWLDTARSELVGGEWPEGSFSGRVFPVDDDTSISIKDHRYVVRKADGLHVVPDVVADGQPQVSPDGTMFAVTQVAAGPLVPGTGEIVVVALAGLDVRRFPLASPAHWLRWSGDSREVRYGHGLDELRLDLATGKSSRLAPGEREAPRRAAPEPPGHETCAVRGQRLEIVRARERQQIVLVPLASPRDPERLSAIEPRVLVESTDHHWNPHRVLSYPGELEHAFFTASCDHFVFALRDRIYVGETRTGRFAFLIAGSEPSRELHRD